LKFGLSRFANDLPRRRFSVVLLFRFSPSPAGWPQRDGSVCLTPIGSILTFDASFLVDPDLYEVFSRSQRGCDFFFAKVNAAGGAYAVVAPPLRSGSRFLPFIVQRGVPDARAPPLFFCRDPRKGSKLRSTRVLVDPRGP